MDDVGHTEALDAPPPRGRPDRHAVRWRALVVAATALAACGGDAPADPRGPTEPATPVVTSVVIEPDEATLTWLGDGTQLSASAFDQSGSPMSDVTFTWSSSHDGVVTVDSDGAVAAMANGEATITATAESVSGEATVTVQQVAASLELQPSSAALVGIGATSDLQLSAEDAGGSAMAAPHAVWDALNPGVVSVTALDSLTGRATAARDGQSIVAVTVDGLTRYALLTVSLPDAGAERTWILDPGSGGTLHSVWGAAPNDVWAVGRYGEIRHFDGTAWTNETPGLTSESLLGVWGTGPDDVWAAGGGPVILHYDGVEWSDVSPPGSSTSLTAVWGAEPTDLWATCDLCEILRYDGAEWTSDAGAAGLRDLWGASKDALWAPGYGGGIRSYDGNGWTLTSPAFVGSAALLGVWGTAEDDVWVVGDGGTVARFDGTGWTDASTAATSIWRLESVWGTGPNDVWVVGSTWIFHFDGVDWTATPSGTAGRVLDVWGSSGGDVWAVGEGLILRGVVGPIAKIDDVELSSTTLTIDGVSVSYTATVTNLVGGTVAPVILQAYVDQGATSRAGGGTGVSCGLPSEVGNLPPGTCSFDFTLSASNGGAGSGTLVAGSATARFELLLEDELLDTLLVAVTLVN